MDSASDRFTIIHQANGGEPETIVIGLTREQARQWLRHKAEATGCRVSQELMIAAADSPTGESWQAVKAE